MASYVIHGTSLDNLVHILKSGYLETNPKYGRKFLDKEHYNPHQIFTQILFKDLPDEVHQQPHWWGIAIVLDKKILKDKRWYATRIGGFREHFNDAFQKKTQKTMKNEEKDFQEPSEILARNPNTAAAKIPSLAKLKKIIIQQMESRFLGEVDFIHSHEVLFGDDISLAEYGVAIVCHEWLITKKLSPTARENITKRCHELGLPLILYGGAKRSDANKNLGINKFIDLIEYGNIS